MPLCAVFLAGCSADRHLERIDERTYSVLAEKQEEAFGESEPFTLESPAQTLRRRLLLEQDLQVIRSSSLLGSEDAMTPEEEAASGNAPELEIPEGEPLQLSLNQALMIAAANSREYQAQKEDVFAAALGLELEREQFRFSFAGMLSAAFSRSEDGGGVEESGSFSAAADATKLFQQGAAMSVRLGWDLLKLLRPDKFISRAFYGDASIAIPLLRGSGKVAEESLTQAERSTIYAIYDFEDFKRSFAVEIAAEYLSVVQREDQVRNAEENYRGLITATRRARRLLEAGELPPIQVDQAIQDELRARNRWVSARETQNAAIDRFKVALGLPADARIVLDREEFERLSAVANRVGGEGITMEKEIPPADAPIVLEEPSGAGAGPLELDPEEAIGIAFENRLDVRIALGSIEDAWRGVEIAQDAFRPGLTLAASASARGDRLEAGAFNDRGYSAELLLDLPLENTSEAANYRFSLLRLASAHRSLQALEDSIKIGIREQLSRLREARETIQIQALSVELAQRRVRGADLQLQAGRVEIRDLLEAREDLLSAQNSLTSAAVDYRLAELGLQRDLGVLEVDANGLWQEYLPSTL